MDTEHVDKEETDISSLVERMAGLQHDTTGVGAVDLAIVLAFLYPDAVFVREQGGEGTSVMRREPDGNWYFVE